MNHLDRTRPMATPPHSDNGMYLFRLIYTAFLSTGLCRAVLLTSEGHQTIRRAEGDSVTLGCTYTWDPSDSGDLDIEWSLVSSDTTMKDQMLLSYSNGKKYIHGVTAQGVDFTAPDPSMGDASLSIVAASLAHSSTYQCKVKKSPGVDMRKVTLVVMEKPSVPKCWEEGTNSVGEALSLHCESLKGAAPLKYTWTRGRESPLPPTLTQDGVSGQLLIRNLSQSLAGIYFCKVSNDVGEERCAINLVANKAPSRAGVIVGTVVGSILLLILLLLLLWLLLCKLSNRRRADKDFSNEIREDVPAPESRPGSRFTNRSSNHYRGGTYSPVPGPEPHFTGDIGVAPPPPASSLGSTVNYNSKYGDVV